MTDVDQVLDEKSGWDRTMEIRLRVSESLIRDADGDALVPLLGTEVLNMARAMIAKEDANHE